MAFSPKIKAFLAAIEVMPNITKAAAAVPMHPSAHYAKLKDDPEYAAAFEESLKIGYDAVSDVAVERATDGWLEPIVYQGGLSYPEKWDATLQRNVPDYDAPPLTVRKIDNKLLQFVLECRHSEYRKKLEVKADVTDKRFRGTLEELLIEYKLAQAE